MFVVLMRKHYHKIQTRPGKYFLLLEGASISIDQQLLCVFILQADADKDGRLTLTEMIDHPYVFYSAIFNEDDEDDYDFHDEFR